MCKRDEASAMTDATGVTEDAFLRQFHQFIADTVIDQPVVSGGGRSSSSN